MKIFMDTANLDELKKSIEYGVVDGVTTNPSLIARENMEFLPLIKEITSLVPGPVSVELTETDAGGMIDQALTGASPDAFIARTDVEHVRSAGIRHPEHEIAVLRELSETFLTLAERSNRSTLLSAPGMEESRSRGAAVSSASSEHSP